MKPNSVNILGTEYTISYFDKPSEVDMYKRESVWGQIDYWTRTIRIYDKGDRPENDVFQSVMHEVLHGISEALKLKLDDTDAKHEQLDILALALTDVLYRNGWITDAHDAQPDEE